MPRYIFDVWTEVHGTIEVEASGHDEAWDKMCDQMYAVELTDEHSDRQAELIHVEEE